MKRILIFLALVFFAITGFSQELSDYEIYRMQKEAELYQPDGDPVCWDKVDVMPKFNGGEDPGEFRKWISLNLEYPEYAVKNGIQGKVFISFIVNKYGNVVNVKVEKSVHEKLDAEAMRVVLKSPKWTPGMQDGIPVDVQFTFPINFVLDEPVDVKPQVINNYYFDDYDIRHNLYFGYSWNYRPYYSYYDPFYYDYWEWNWYIPNYYTSWYYRPHYSYYRHWNHKPYYRYTSTYYYGHLPNRSSYGYRSRPSTLQDPKQYTTRTSTNRPQTSVRTNSERSPYTPIYNRPHTPTRPAYNTSKPIRTTTSQQYRNVEQRTTYSKPQATSRPSSSYSRPSSSRSTYTQPSRSSSSSYSRAPSSPSRSTYSQPSRSSSSSYSRPSSSGVSRSTSSGSVSRGSSTMNRGKK